MEKLTRLNGIGEYEPIQCFECGPGCGIDNENCGTCEVMADVEQRLGEYEAIGTIEEFSALKVENERLRAERDAAIQDLYDMACGMREQPSDTACCFACKWNDIDECAGFESNSCFVWRGLEGNDG